MTKVNMHNQGVWFTALFTGPNKVDCIVWANTPGDVMDNDPLRSAMKAAGYEKTTLSHWVDGLCQVSVDMSDF